MATQMAALRNLTRSRMGFRVAAREGAPPADRTSAPVSTRSG